ncbi:MAG: hypothetical protein JWM16_5720, partial [Verrucomicrobiales bacterium]|nr:hypothetical protein [Verrucomicrobiales bacterium]
KEKWGNRFKSHVAFVGIGLAMVLLLAARMNTILELLQPGFVQLAHLGPLAAQGPVEFS